MKKLSLIIIAVLGFSISSFASDDYKVLPLLTEKSTFTKVVDYVRADYDQRKEIEAIINDSASRLEYALEEGDAKAAERALYYNLANVKSVLTSSQYKKYLSALNIALYQQEYGVSK